MSLASRLAFVGRAVSSLFSERRYGAFLEQISPQRQTPKRGASEMPRFVKKSPLAAMLSYRIADGLAAQRWRLWQPTRRSAVRHLEALRYLSKEERAGELKDLARTGEAREITEHPFLDIQTRNVPEIRGRDLRHMSYLHYELTGEAYWALLRNGTGAPAGALIIPPSWVWDTPRASDPTYKIRWQSVNHQVAASDMLLFKRADPENPYGRGVGAFAALTGELETDEFASEYLRLYFLNDARPPMVIAGAGIDKAQAKILEQGWLSKHQGFRKAWVPHFMNAAENLVIKELSQGFNKDMVELRSSTKEFAREYFGIPPEILGDIGESKRSTIDLADYIFARWVLTPRLEAFLPTMQAFVAREYDERILVDFESPVREDKEFALQVRQAFPWAFRIDEHREMGGAAELGKKAGGESFAVPTSLTSMRDWIADEDRDEPEPDTTDDPEPPAPDSDEE